MQEPDEITKNNNNNNNLGMMGQCTCLSKYVLSSNSNTVSLTEPDKEEAPLLLNVGPGWKCALQENDGVYKVVATHELTNVSIIATRVPNEYTFDHKETRMVQLTDVVKLEIIGPGVLKRRVEYGQVINCPVTKDAFRREAKKNIETRINEIARVLGESVE